MGTRLLQHVLQRLAHVCICYIHREFVRGIWIYKRERLLDSEALIVHVLNISGLPAFGPTGSVAHLEIRALWNGNEKSVAPFGEDVRTIYSLQDQVKNVPINCTVCVPAPLMKCPSFDACTQRMIPVKEPLPVTHVDLLSRFEDRQNPRRRVIRDKYK